ncbi:hypothetical protein WG922_06200 [Ramlibacter sp. AN1015]|uniref:hypothetical protein n=1 Tax=Ramlibacter sp. AN1015 TaxID=3133428 RepID=UPI0030BF2FD5
MSDLFERFVRVIVRCVLLVLGLVVAASLAFAGLVLLGGWALYAGWARLTGRPVAPFVMRMDPRAGFGRFWSQAARAEAPSRTPRADANRGTSPAARRLEVTDVEARAPQD